MNQSPHEIDRDPADFNVGDDGAEMPDEFVDGICDKCGMVVQVACPDCGSYIKRGNTDSPEHINERRFYHALLLGLRNERKIGFSIDCYFIATGDAIMDGAGSSMAGVAKLWGVHKAMVSKHCREICTKFRLTPSRYMRSEEAANESRLRNRRNRKPK